MTTFLFYYSLALTIVVLWQNADLARRLLEFIVRLFRER